MTLNDPTVRRLATLIVLITAACASRARAESTVHRIDQFRLAWTAKSEMLPPLREYLDTTVRLDRTARAYTAAQPGAPAIRTDIDALSRQGVVRIDTAGLDAIAQALAARVEREGLIGATVSVGLEPLSSAAGRGAEAAWFIVELPLDAQANPEIPGDLIPLHKVEPAPAEPDEPLQPDLPDDRDADEAEPIRPDAIPAPAAPEADEEPVEPGPAPVQTADEKPQPAAAAPPPDRVLPVEQPTATASVPATTLEGLEVHWDATASTWGDPTAAFSTVTADLTLVDDVVQAAGEPGGDAVPLRDLTQFPPRAWQPSAIAAVGRAIDARLADLGMIRTGVTHAVETIDERSVLVFTLHPPPRPAHFPPEATMAQGAGNYLVWPFELAYAAKHADLPAASSFMHLPLTLTTSPEGWSGSRTDTPVNTSLGAINEAGPMVFNAGAILTIDTEIAKYLAGHDLMGVAVSPLSTQISVAGDSAGTDLRGGATDMILVISVGRVAAIRTVASGERIDTDERMDNPIHERIVAQSPLDATTPGENGDDDLQGHLLRRKVLEDYTHFLSRHPGRDVEASVAAGANPGDVSLDYVISEAKPWTLWYQYGNTGTKSEQYMRNRVGFYTTQFTNNDDIFSLQYITSDLQSTNAVLGSYEAPLSDDGRLRWRASGSWSQYFADQFGVPGLGAIQDAFTGYSWAGSGELRWNVYQEGPFFMDLIGGVRLQHIGVNNNILGQSDQASFLLPYGMIQAEEMGEWSNFQASLGIEGNVLSHSQQTLQTLGRLNPSDKWARLNWGLSWSTFLEPLLDPAGWNDPNSPESSRLAHEVLLGFGGQYAFGARLLPQFQQTAGGPTSNRGYPVSVVAGDTVFNLTGEYRLHLPRTFDIQPEPGTLMGEPFRLAPQYVYGRPDWDLSLLAFIDASWLFQDDAAPGETNETLLSTGIGMEFLFKRNFRVRLDWGWALRSLENGLYDSGHDRLYVQASLYF